MYIKSLEIQGFKSFPDKTVLTFDQDITAIVGPNGSGKSNIADALRWVMGEQSSKTLRGGKMEDVIFGGTQQRKQTGFAQVSLVLDNSEHILDMEESEVMVTRRYYRSGESEYFINRRSCRLKDVSELFMDTGMGRDGYSIIGQGRIDEILSVRSQDRREIFEEAAGISRYRHRKEESERRLERTEENLVRINDKIAELELQVGPLKEQAEKAKQYLKLRDEQRGLEVSLWMNQLDRLRAGKDKLAGDYAEAARQRDEAAQAQENLYTRSEEIRQRLREKEEQAEELRSERSRQDSRKADSESRIAVLKNQKQGNEDTARRLKIELGDSRDRENSIASQIAQREQRLSEISEERSALSGKLGRQEAASRAQALETEEAEQKLSGLRSDREKKSGESAEARARLSALAATSQELMDRDTALRSELSSTQEQEESARKALEQNRSRQKSREEKRQESQNRIHAWEMKARNSRQKTEELSAQTGRMRVEDNTLRSRIKMLSEMEKVYEGYSKAVKQVMAEAKRGGLSHIRGPVAELLRVPDEYTVALETALGGAMQNIVVDREEDGKKAISWLKHRDAGRATFLPLSVIRPNTLQEKGVEQEPGFVGIASTLAEYDPEYRDLFANLLGRTVVAEDLDAAIAIADRHHHRFRIVTLDGQVLNPGGSMTGGSVSRNAGILSRANELKRLQKQEKELQEDLTEAEEKLAEEKQQTEKLDYQVTAENGELRRIEDELLKLRTEEQHEEQNIRDLESRMESSRKELSLLENRSGQNEEEIAGARESIRSCEQEIADLQKQEEAQSGVIEGLQKKLDEQNAAVSALKVEMAGLDSEEETSRSALDQLKELQLDLSGDRESRLRRLDELSGENRSLEEEIRKEQEALEEISARREELEQQASALNEEKLALEAERSRLDRESRDRNDELLNMEREVAALEQKKNAAATEENQLLDKLWENYELSFSEAQKVRFQLESETKASRRVSELRKEISGLGNVNVGAVEEFERVNGRYTYLTEQRDDVAKSKEELLSIIRDITGEMEVIFRREFKKIQEAFSTTFVELFGGGRAALELEDPDDVLNCGIEIKAQPPGKSLKTISLLSGGEKAFVAIALYFAILKVRPTPFVVMDEIEAALDDSNVVKFARYLRTMTSHTQFLVITHRRGTMEEADVLYGVTMQEQGVSRMLTLNLDEVEEKLNMKAE